MVTVQTSSEWAHGEAESLNRRQEVILKPVQYKVFIKCQLKLQYTKQAYDEAENAIYFKKYTLRQKLKVVSKFSSSFIFSNVLTTFQKVTEKFVNSAYLW